MDRFELDTYEKVLAFLDLAVKTTKEHAKGQKLKQKPVYYKHAKEIKEARRILLKLYYSFEDYLASGQYEVPKISTKIYKIAVETV